MHADSVHGSLEKKMTDFAVGFEGSLVAMMGVLSNTVCRIGLGAHFFCLWET